MLYNNICRNEIERARQEKDGGNIVHLKTYHKLIQMALYRPSNVSYKLYEKLKVIHIMEGKQKAKSYGKNQKSSTHIIIDH